MRMYRESLIQCHGCLWSEAIKALALSLEDRYLYRLRAESRERF